jgi:o-succinylbenzoate synthase
MLEVAAYPYQLHFKRPAATSRGYLTTRSIWLLRAWDTTEPDRSGWGEYGPLPGLSRDETPDFAENVAEAIDVINAGYQPEPGDLPHLPSFAFGLETALRDLAMGGRRKLWDTPFARGAAGLPTHGLIWMDSPDGLLQQIETKLAAGFTVLKLKVGALPFDQELALLAQLRAAYPQRRLEVRLDANGAFAPDAALGQLDQLAAYDIAFLEQPVRAGQWGALAEICAQSPIPIVLDEELIPIADAETRRQLLDFVQPQGLIIKPALLGGFFAGAVWIADAEARSIRWWINSLLESNIGLNAICQWTSAIGGERVHGLGAGGLFTNNIPAPLALTGHTLHIDPAGAWQWPLELPVGIT